MKLFQSLLVAPAALGLFAPISASASEVNLNEISNYSDVESIEFANSFEDDASNTSPLLAGGEGLVENGYDGGFSSTTTAAFSADFMIGAVYDDDNVTVNGNDLDDNVTAGYSFQIDLNTSFTGEDSLDISLDAGNSGSSGVAEFDGNSGSEALTVDGIAYTWPVTDALTAMVGDNMDASSLFTKACVYGGPSNTLDDCGAPNAFVTNGGVMAGVAYDFGSGFTAAVGYAGDETDVMNEEGEDDYGVNVAYTGDNYGLSLTYGLVEQDDTPAGTTETASEDTFVAFNAYYTPETAGFPSISFGYEVGDDGSVTTSADSLTSIFFGFSWDEIGPGSGGFALGTRTPTVEDTDAQYMYEVYYSYPINDGMTVTPLVFIQEQSADGVESTKGYMVKTSFSF